MSESMPPKPTKPKAQEKKRPPRTVINGSDLYFSSCSVKNWKATDGRDRFDAK